MKQVRPSAACMTVSMPDFSLSRQRSKELRGMKLLHGRKWEARGGNNNTWLMSPWKGEAAVCSRRVRHRRTPRRACCRKRSLHSTGHSVLLGLGLGARASWAEPRPTPQTAPADTREVLGDAPSGLVSFLSLVSNGPAASSCGKGHGSTQGETTADEVPHPDPGIILLPPLVRTELGPDTQARDGQGDPSQEPALLAQSLHREASSSLQR